MSDELREETESTQAGLNGLAWFVTGAMIGVAIAVLYAPKSGKDSRQYLSDKGKETLDKGKETLGDTGKNFVETGKELFEHGRQLVEDAADLFERGRKLVKG